MNFDTSEQQNETPRALLLALRSKGLPRGMIAAVLGRSPHSLRRWETGERNPRLAPRRRIRATFRALGELHGMALARAVQVRCCKNAYDESLPVARQLEAARGVARAAELMVKLGKDFFARLDRMDEPRAAKG